MLTTLDLCKKRAALILKLTYLVRQKDKIENLFFFKHDKGPRFVDVN